MIRSLLRTCSPFLLAAALVVAANPAHALLHIITFSDSSVTGSFDVDVTGAGSGTVFNCDVGPPCDFSSFTVTFDGGEFTLDDLPGEVLRGYMGTGGFVDELLVLMDDNFGSASGAFLNMFRDPNDFSVELDLSFSATSGVSASGIGPAGAVGTYTITVPEPGIAGLFAFAALGLAALRRRG